MRLHSLATSPPARVVLALVVGRHEQARLIGSLRGSTQVICESSLTKFRERLSEHLDRLHAAVLELADAQGNATAPYIAQIRASLPRLPLVGYCRFPKESSGDLVAFAKAGVHEVIFRDLDDTGIALQAALRSAEQGLAADRVLARLRPLLDSDVMEIIEFGMTRGRRPLSVRQVADALGVSRRTLLNRCHRAHLPSPAFVLGWCRLFLAASLLDGRLYTVERVADLLEFPSVTALRNAMRRYVGLTATDVRRVGGLEHLLTRFCEITRSGPVAVEERTATRALLEGQAGR